MPIPSYRNGCIRADGYIGCTEPVPLCGCGETSDLARWALSRLGFMPNRCRLVLQTCCTCWRQELALIPRSGRCTRSSAFGGNPVAWTSRHAGVLLTPGETKTGRSMSTGQGSSS
jgi:hypothetical protein